MTPGNQCELNELILELRRFCQERDWDQFHGAKDLAIGMVTECSELLELFRFQSDQQVAAALADGKCRRAIGQELADVLFFVLRFADRFGFDLVHEFREKMKLNAQKYPVAEFRGRNHKSDRVPIGS